MDIEASIELKKDQEMDFIIAEDRRERLEKILYQAREILRMQSAILV